MEVEAKMLTSSHVLDLYLEQAMQKIRAVMANDREYPFLKEIQNYYQDATYLVEYISEFNENYTSFNEKLDDFQKQT